LNVSISAAAAVVVVVVVVVMVLVVVVVVVEASVPAFLQTTALSSPRLVISSTQVIQRMVVS
uniref:Col_cuticle_N domain-containing protein n=1 Tax=Hydatigena taeniaeformis TaxID=6205 RepID=A0A0R3WNC2_HYDTA